MSDESKKTAKTRTVKVDYLARVEGEGALSIKTRGDVLEEVHLKIFEPPRFFEGLLRGRDFAEAPDITARICGICPVAYQMSAVHAMEQACGVTVGGSLRELRRLLYCGEWIESHTLHIYMLHAPDFLGFHDVVEVAKHHKERVEAGLRLKKLGNTLVNVVGGREIHPINVKVGGFYRAPTKAELQALLPELDWAIGLAADTAEWVNTFAIPEAAFDYELVCLRHPEEYPMNEGRIVSNKGLDIEVSDYEEHFEEIHQQRSTALHSVRKPGRTSFLTGPMARFAQNYDRLPTDIQHLAQKLKQSPVNRNPFRSIVTRALEVMYACVEAKRIIESYEPPPASAVEVKPRAGRGHALTEAPRGTLYHRYDIDAEGKIDVAKIVAPTSQNQLRIEDDLRGMLPDVLSLGDEELTHRMEMAIRNYDPCISCSAHFLKLKRERIAP